MLQCDPETSEASSGSQSLKQIDTWKPDLGFLRSVGLLGG